MKYVQICLLISALLLTGCLSSQIDDCKEVVTPHLNAPDPQPLEMSDIAFVLVTNKNADHVFYELEESGVDPVVWGLTDDDYKDLATNIEKLQLYIMKQQDIIEAYRQYYEAKFDGVDVGHPE